MLGDRGDVYHAKPPLSRVPCTLRSDHSRACHRSRYREILPNRIFPCQGATLGMPHTYPMGEGLFELRVTGQEGIARVFYCFYATFSYAIMQSKGGNHVQRNRRPAKRVPWLVAPEPFQASGGSGRGSSHFRGTARTEHSRSCTGADASVSCTAAS